MNQYWYSATTIQNVVDEIEKLPNVRAAFLSTPSLYFSLSKKVREQCFVFDFDKKWSKDRGFVFYDFNKPSEVSPELKGTFNLIVIDPPFITEDVWSKYAITAKLLLKPGNSGQQNLICTTVQENAPMMHRLLGVQPCSYRPSIPNLVYQYCLYTNFESEVFSKCNPEIDPDNDYNPPLVKIKDAVTPTGTVKTTEDISTLLKTNAVISTDEGVVSTDEGVSTE